AIPCNLFDRSCSQRPETHLGAPPRAAAAEKVPHPGRRNARTYQRNNRNASSSSRFGTLITNAMSKLSINRVCAPDLQTGSFIFMLSRGEPVWKGSGSQSGSGHCSPLGGLPWFGARVVLRSPAWLLPVSWG